jgi:integrase
MSSNLQISTASSCAPWQMPIDPAIYDQRPLTASEWRALELDFQVSVKTARTVDSIAGRTALVRFDTPLADVFHLRHQGSADLVYDVQHLFRSEMHRHQKMFWEWTPQEWKETLCPTPDLFLKRYGKWESVRMTVMDAAYLLGNVSDLRSVGIGRNAVSAAAVYFGRERVNVECTRLFDLLKERGYVQTYATLKRMQHGLSMLFLLNRSPFLEGITFDLLACVRDENSHMRQVYGRIEKGLEQLKILSPPVIQARLVDKAFDGNGVGQEWFDWCLAWYERAVDLTPGIRRKYANHLLAVGRWLEEHAKNVRTPEQWTEDLALRFRSDLCSWTMGQYVNQHGRKVLSTKGRLAMPLKAQGITNYLTALRRFFLDLTKRDHAPGGTPARKIHLDFQPRDVFAPPRYVRQAIDRAEPRDIDLRVWARLAIAAATLSHDDLPQGAVYPLSFYRALALVWVTSARRPNEIARLRLDCLREDWDPAMLDEDQQPVVRWLAPGPRKQGQDEEKVPKIFYLHIPSGKNRGAFWIWLPDYTAEAITAWKAERPERQKQLFDWKDHEYIDYLFCCRDKRIGPRFLNRSLIPALCAKAGVELADARGRITGHRGRSTRLTLLRRSGVSLDDLAEYAGHADTRTIRRYARQQPFHLHQIIRDADDVSRVIEGVVDVQAAAQGVPALRWFIGYDADGEPMYCGNQLYVTCPHRLDCERCGMFIGGEKAKLFHEGEQMLPVTSKVPMTPLEKCVVEGDQAGVQACRTALQHLPAPEAPDIRLIFTPEGLSNAELEKLAEGATAESLEKLRQAKDAHEKHLTEMQQQHKTGRNALVTAQKKRISFIQDLIVHGEQRMREQQGNPGA